MITNERQYAITKAKVAQFKKSLGEKSSPDRKLHPKIRKAMQEGLQSQLNDLEKEIADFEKLRDGSISTIVVNSIVGIAVALIQARIARKWTQKQLAEKLNLQEQQIQRYESTRYKGVAVERLQEVADTMGVQVQEVVTLKPEANQGTRKGKRALWERGFKSHVLWRGKERLAKVRLDSDSNSELKYIWEAAGRSGKASTLSAAKATAEYALLLANKQLLMDFSEARELRGPALATDGAA